MSETRSSAFKHTHTHTHTHSFFTLAFCIGSVIALPFCICIGPAALLVCRSVWKALIGVGCLSFCLLSARQPQWARAPSFTRFLDHTQQRITVGRTPLDEWSARSRDLYLITHNTHNRQTYKPPVGFESTIPAGERPQTAWPMGPAIGIGTDVKYFIVVQFTVAQQNGGVTAQWWTGLDREGAVVSQRLQGLGKAAHCCPSVCGLKFRLEIRLDQSICALCKGLV